MSPVSANPDPGTPVAARARDRRRFWSWLALSATVLLGSCAGCLAWVLPDGQLAVDAEAGNVGKVLDEALRSGDAGLLATYVRAAAGTRVCFAREYRSLSSPPWRAYWRTYGLPDRQVPDAHWAVAVLRTGAAPEFVVVPTQKLILGGSLGCADAGRLRFHFDSVGGPPLVLRPSIEP